MTRARQDDDGRRGSPAPLLVAADHLSSQLFWWLLAAAAAGVAAEGAATSLSAATPLLLAVMVLGLGLGVAVTELGSGLARPRLLAAVAAGQLLVTPLIGWGLTTLDGDIAVGAVVQAVAPAEITAPLLVALAGGTVAVALPVMALTVLLAPLTMPPLLALIVGGEVAVETGSLITSLALTVAVPLLVGSGVATLRRDAGDRLARLGRGLSAAMVVLLVFAVAGRAAGRLSGRGLDVLLAAAGMAVVLVVASFVAGAVAARATGLPAADRRVVLFSVGMREFGIATAVALSFFDAEAALVPAVYGPIMMLTAAWIASRSR